ncbi:MAG: hypothetical protein K2X93_21510 [Candidatus Obscuribacterales bacterium]|nr:hypothetical protein [Candidatus Obscuribacterales bacterium]
MSGYTVKVIAAALAIALSLRAPLAYANEPLQGGVEETGILPSEAKKDTELLDMPTPVLPEVQPDKGKLGFGKYDQAEQPLQGNIRENALQGNAEDEGDPGLGEGSAQMDNQANKPLQGRAELGNDGLGADDPDMDDQELQVAWDRWRNKLLWAVQSGVQEALNNPDDTNLRWDPQRQAVVMRFPIGTTAWFACKINSTRHVVSVKIMHSSGFPGYDKAVEDSVRNLEGTSILQFPRRSRRTYVTQSAGIKTSDSGGKQFFKFGDVERYRQGN